MVASRGAIVTVAEDTEPSMLDAALEWARRGFRVVPLWRAFPDTGACECKDGVECGRSRGKHPRVYEWQHRATREESAIRAWWRRWPCAGIGLAMGGADRFVAIDIDGEVGRASLARLEREHEPLPDTRTTRSGRDDGGEHRLFRVPDHLDLDAIVNNASKLADHLDVRTTGGQIVAPPTLHYSGRRYTVARDIDVAELPEWLYRRIVAAKPEPARTEIPRATVHRVAGGRSRKYVDGALESACAAIRAAPDGTQNNEINAQAFSIGQLVAGGEIGEQEAFDALLAAAREGGHPERRAMGAIKSGLTAGAREPRTVPDPSPQLAPRAREPAREDHECESDAERPYDKLQPPPKRVAADAKPKPPPIHTLADVARTRLCLGPAIATEFDGFDGATRGGFRRSRWIVFGGAPDAGKTTLCINMAMNCARRGVFVGFLACDEDMARIVERIGQSLGFDQEALSGEDPSQRELLAATLAADFPHVMLFDGDEHTIESATAALYEFAEGRDAVLVLDSLQSARSEFLEGNETDKARVDIVVRAVKRSAKVGVIVLAISELNRGSYRTRDSAQAVVDLAAFKESGSVEYGAPVALVMRSVPGTPDQVDVTFAKNKLRGVGVAADYSFRLRLDRQHATFESVDTPVVSAADAERIEEDEQERIAKANEHRLRAKVLAAIGKYPGMPTKAAIVAAAKARKGNVNAMIDLLVAEGQIEKRDGYRIAVPVVPAGSDVVPGTAAAESTAAVPRFPIGEPEPHAGTAEQAEADGSQSEIVGTGTADGDASRPPSDSETVAGSSPREWQPRFDEWIAKRCVGATTAAEASARLSGVRPKALRDLDADTFEREARGAAERWWLRHGRRA